MADVSQPGEFRYGTWQPVRLWNKLIEPSVLIREPQRHRRARILSAMLLLVNLLAVISLILTNLSIFPEAWPTRVNLISIDLGAFLILLLAYWLSRTRYFEAAAVLTILTIQTACFAAILTNPEVKFVPAFPILGGLMGSQFLPRRVTIWTFGLTLLGLFLLPFIIPNIWGPDLFIAGFFILTVGMVMTLGATLQQLDLAQIMAQTRALAEREVNLEAAVQSSLATNQNLADRMGELKQRADEITLLSRMGQMLQACRTDAEAHKVIGQYVSKLFLLTSGAVYLIRSSRNNFEPVVSWGSGSPQLEKQIFSLEECWAVRRGQVHIVQDHEVEVYCPHVLATGRSGLATMCLPMTAQGEVIGILHISADTALARFGDVERQLGQAVAEELALALANMKLRETLRHQSIRDPLTGLFNRRYFEEIFERELLRADRNQTGLGVVMIDIDHFKQFNDNLGHQAGDALLRELGNYLLTRIRGTDIVCRFGGEEFVLILPDSSLEMSCKIAEELCEGIAALRVQFRGESLAQITVSLGVAGYPEHGNVMEKLLRSADVALYRSKQAGRNQVTQA